MRVTMIGTGYVGLVAGAGFADFGNEVTCVDRDELKIARLQRGELPLYEPGLPELLVRNLRRGNLRFSTDLRQAVADAQVVFIAVGTPETRNGAADLSDVLAAADQLGPLLRRWTVVATKSTVPPGTWEEIRRRIAARTTQPFAVVSNPEFLKEGDAINDFWKPYRVIVGSDDPRAHALMAQLYAPVLSTNDRLQAMDATSAELTKYAANALLAVRISFMNELANLTEQVGGDIEQVRRGLGADPRIGPQFLFAGAGYGGSGFPKDLRALLCSAEVQGLPLEVVAAAERANRLQKEVLPQKVEHGLGDLAGKTVAVWGLAFKPGTDDVRESPALSLVGRLLDGGAKVVAHDPAAMDNAAACFGDRLQLAPGMYQAAEGADALVLVTEWHEFRHPDFPRLRRLLRAPNLFDGRNIWDPAEVRALGFRYVCIGRR